MYVEVFSANSVNKLTSLKLSIAATETWWSPLYHMFVLSSQVSVSTFVANLAKIIYLVVCQIV